MSNQITPPSPSDDSSQQPHSNQNNPTTQIQQHQVQAGNTEMFPSAELLLSSIQRESDLEEERSKTIDTRVNIFITLAGALLAFLSSYVMISDRKKVKVESVYEAIPYAIFIVLIFATIAMLILAIVYFFRTIWIREYQRIRIVDFTDERTNRLPKDKIARHPYNR